MAAKACWRSARRNGSGLWNGPFWPRSTTGLESLLSTGQIAGLQCLPQLQHVGGTVVKACL